MVVAAYIVGILAILLILLLLHLLVLLILVVVAAAAVVIYCCTFWLFATPPSASCSHQVKQAHFGLKRRPGANEPYASTIPKQSLVQLGIC